MKTTIFLVIAVLISCKSIAQDEELRASINPLLYPFYHGVASGDPLDDRVILWTRFTDDTLNVDSVRIDWRVALDTGMTNIVNYGYGYTSENKDWTFKVDADGLQPNTWYYYDFYASEKYSIRGRTKTAPVGDIDSVRFAVVSCSNWEHGYFGSYRHLRDRNDFDAVLHLGDYIYEYEVGGYSANIGNRENVPTNEIITLEDYRLRYSHYRLDNDLRKLHQQVPFINIWDDHESANDSYKDGAENHDPNTEGTWASRKTSAAQAYREWLPIREPQPGTDRIYRKFSWGDLLDLYMLDTRLEGRDEQVGTTSSLINDPNRSILGSTQYNWLTSNMQSSTTQWQILGQQVMMAPFEVFGEPVNADQWDGYKYERDQLFNFFDSNIDNLVVLTGDIHTSWVNDLPLSNYDGSSCTGSVGVEYVVTSVTSPGFPIGVGESLIHSFNPHMQYTDLTSHGYMILDINKTRVQGDYYYLNDIEDENTNQYPGDAYQVLDGEKCANQSALFSSRESLPPVLAPDSPIISLTDIQEASNATLLGTYPNPFHSDLTVQLYLQRLETIHLELYNISGQMIYSDEINSLNRGINYLNINLNDMEAGSYLLVIKGDHHQISKPILKLN